MAEGPGDIDIRKVQLTGGVTHTISLPKKWIMANNIEPRDSLKLDWRPSGAIRLTPLETTLEQVKTISVNAETLPEGSLHDHLMAAYIAGSTQIKIIYSEHNGKVFSRTIRRFLRNTRGFEIIEEDENSQLLVSLLKSAEMPLQASINRMYLQLSSLTRDVLSIFEGDSLNALSDDSERESDVDAMLYLVERQVAVILDNHSVASSLEINRNQATQYAKIANSLERMMDHMYQISRMICETTPLPQLQSTVTPLAQIPIWQNALKQMMIDIRTQDSHTIEEARTALKKAQKHLQKHEEDMMASKARMATMLFEFRLSESIRRLCAYSLDIGETLLNMRAYDQMYV